MKNFDRLAIEKSSKINLKDKNIAVVLAAGHGKRIRASLPKVAHLVWGKPSVSRVLEAMRKGLKTKNEVVVVGRKADKVINLLGEKNNRIFAYQKKQLGTGDAVKVSIKNIPASYNGSIFILPGDVGLIDDKTLLFFKKKFIKSNADMMLLTGNYLGKFEENYFGRVVRVPEFDANGDLTLKKNVNKVISIVQHQDILNLNQKIPLRLSYKGNEYHFSKKELLNIKEFDSAIFAFKFLSLKKYLNKLSNKKNIQQEFYLTDLVEIFNLAGLKVESITPPNDHEVLLGFNDKTVWKTIEKVFRKRYYDKLKNIIDIEDENRFFINEKVVQDLEKLDLQGPLDLYIASGVHIGGEVKLARGVYIGANTRINGNVILEEEVELGQQVRIETMSNQTVIIRKGTKLAGNNVIKGNVEIKKNVLISESVNLTGSDEFPTIIGNNASLLGTCYLLGTYVEDNAVIESSILIKKKINCVKCRDGSVQSVKFIIPPPVGVAAVEDKILE